MPSAKKRSGTTKRLSRIRRRATPEVRQAYEQGKISARRADRLLSLKPEAQRAELSRLLATKETADRRARLTAQIIREHIAGGRIDLETLQRSIREALAGP
jgi:hypothetical protein